MNADAAGIRDPHLDLSDLIAEAAGRPPGARAREHLAACENCRREANRWSLVADAVRSVAFAAPEAAELDRPHSIGPLGTTPLGAPPLGGRPPGPGRLARGRRRRAMQVAGGAMLVAASAAAALALIVWAGVTAGVVHIHFGSGSAAAPALTAVTGCARLEQADGTLEQVRGSSLVIRTAGDQPVTVTTTATTPVSVSGALPRDITDGASVMVRGYRSGGTITAVIVTVGQPFSAVRPPGFAVVRGTVSEASAVGFTLVTPGGSRVRVTTSGSTLVVVPHASLSQLRTGAMIFALGHAEPDGTLSARALAAVSRQPPGLHITVSVKDCSPRSVDEAIDSITGAPGRAG